MKARTLSQLGLCRKAGKLVCGFDAVAEAAKKHEAQVVLVSNDLSPKSKKEVEFIMNKENIEVLPVDATMDEIKAKTGKRAGILAVTEKNLAESVRTAIRRANEEE